MEWITYDGKEDVKTWLENIKPSQVLETSSSEVCGIRITVPISTDSLNNNSKSLEEGFRSLTSQKNDIGLVHIEEQGTTVLVSTDKLLLKVNASHVDDVFGGLVMNLHHGDFGREVHRVEVSLVADENKMRNDYVICVYNANFTGACQSQNRNETKDNNNFPVNDLITKNHTKIDNRNGGIKNNKKVKPCPFFNEGSCKFGQNHLSKSKLTRWVHTCGFCFAKCVEEKPHPESHCKKKAHPESQCVGKKNAQDSLLEQNRSDAVSRRNRTGGDENENVMKNKEGSTFTLVRSNVYPKCSCPGGDKGCMNNSCACVKIMQECHPDCSCGDTCINMGLTRGVFKLLRIGRSRVQGDGCFTEEDIRKGEYVGEYTGKLVLRADQMKRKNPSKYLFQIGHEEILLDAENFGSELAKMNHQTEKKGANCMYQLKRANGVWKVGVWALKNIKKGDELFANYSDNYRGHGLFTPQKKKSGRGRKKETQLEKKGKMKNNNKKLNQRPLSEKQPSQSPSSAAFISHDTKMSNDENIKSSKTNSKKTPRVVSNKKTPGASTPTHLRTPKRVVGDQEVVGDQREAGGQEVVGDQRVAGGLAVSVTCVKSSPVIKDLPRPRPRLLIMTDMASPNAATKTPNSCTDNENGLKPRELEECKGTLYNCTSVRRSPRIMAKTQNENLRLRSPDIETKNLNSGKVYEDIDGEDRT